jgi:hypothetical protein
LRVVFHSKRAFLPLFLSFLSARNGLCLPVYSLRWYEWPEVPTLPDRHGRRQPVRPCQDKGRGFKMRLTGIAARAQEGQGAVLMTGVNGDNLL